MKKFLLLTIPALLLTVMIVTSAHSWLATALCQRFGVVNTASGQAGSYGLTYGVVSARASVEIMDHETIRFYTNTASASAYDDGDAAYSGYAFGSVRGYDNLGQIREMRRTHTN